MHDNRCCIVWLCVSASQSEKRIKAEGVFGKTAKTTSRWNKTPGKYYGDQVRKDHTAET